MQSVHEIRVELVKEYLTSPKNTRLREQAETKIEEEISRILGEEFEDAFLKLKLGEKQKEKARKHLRDRFIKTYELLI
jgi:hypothetical protein